MITTLLEQYLLPVGNQLPQISVSLLLWGKLSRLDFSRFQTEEVAP